MVAEFISCVLSCLRLAVPLAVTIAIAVAPTRAFAQAATDHDKTRFPLTGRHQRVACESCHPPSAASRQWTGVPRDCRGCHGDRRNHRGELGNKCERCHDTTGWSSIRYTRAQHRFTLEGTHDRPCASCHRGGARLISLQAGCRDCHLQPHTGTSAACTTCHNRDSWKQVSFRHAQDPSALGGKHRTATCAGCHPSFQFAGKSSRCDSCHLPDLPHENIGACDGCHSSLGWRKLTLAPAAAGPRGRYAVNRAFDHLAHRKKVTARGGRTTCAPCHTAFKGPRPRGRPTMESCESCHDGTTAFAALGTRCSRCHPTPPAARTTSLPELPPAVPFQHQTHNRLKNMVCGRCHTLTSSSTSEAGRVGRNDHEPCTHCHGIEFRSPGSPLCLTCHAGNEPFAPNPLLPNPRVGEP